MAQGQSTAPTAKWHYHYFVGVSETPASSLHISESLVKKLLADIGCSAALAASHAVGPLHLYNNSGMTPWQVAMSVMQFQFHDAIEAVEAGEATIVMPSEFLHRGFSERVTWPDDVVQKHDLSIEKGHLFFLPFFLHRSAPALEPMLRPASLPAAACEIFGVSEFFDSEPEKLLARFAELAARVSGRSSDTVVSTHF